MDDLARRLDDLERRLGRLEQQLRLQPAPAPVHGPPAPPPPRRTVDLEGFLGRHGLALAGGTAVIAGLGFFVVLAATRGWLGEGVRVVLSAVGSAALLAIGVWRSERRGGERAGPAPQALAGAGVAGLFLTLTAATVLYGLIPTIAGLAAALAVGALATAIAIRMSSPVVAGLGIVGALLSPVLVGADPGLAVVGFLAAALAAGTVVLVWRRWQWLALLAFLSVMPQLVAFAAGNPPPSDLLPVLALFGALHLVGAIGHDWRVAEHRLRPLSSLLVAANAALVAGLAAAAEPEVPMGGWTAGVAAVHGATGVAALVARPARRGIALVLLAAAITLGNVAFGLLVDGVVLPVGWALSAAVIALVARDDHRPPATARWSPSPRGSEDHHRPAGLAIAAQLALAALHVLGFEAPPEALVDGVRALGPALAALGAIALAGAVAARCGWPRGWVVTGVAALFGASVAISTLVAGQRGQLLISALWASSGLATLWAGLRADHAGVRRGGLALLALALAKAVLYDLAALDVGYRAASFVALGLLLIAGAFAYQRLRPGGG
jgi:uncharacterized membrane protein